MLPKAARVAFVAEPGGKSKVLGFAAWDDVTRVMETSMRETGDYPARFAVEGFPTASQLREMRLE